MDTRSHGVLVNTVGFLYASLGFSLVSRAVHRISHIYTDTKRKSVLAALFGLFHRSDIKPPSPPKIVKPILSRGRPSTGSSRPQRQPIKRSFSDQSPKSPSMGPFPFSPQKSIEPSTDAQLRKKMLASHRRSRSIPVITINFFGSTESLRHTPPEVLKLDSPLIDAPLPPLPKPKRLTFVIGSPPERDPRPQVVPEPERPGFKFSKMWVKEKDLKPKPRMQRAASSPQLAGSSHYVLPKSPAPASLVPKLAQTHRVSSSDETLSDSGKSESGLKLRRRSPLRKVPSVPFSLEDSELFQFGLT